MFEQIARKPVVKQLTYPKFGFVLVEHDTYLCPKCKKILNAGPNYQPRYCDKCGQRVTFDGIAWREDRERGFVHEQIEDRVV